MYSIKAVSRITGIPAPTIRSWERRYGVVSPEREGNRRLYGDREVQRLSRVKNLVDAGHRIGDVATLTDSELRDLRTGPAGRGGAVVEELLAALDRYDLRAVDDLLGRAMVAGSLDTLIGELLSPLLSELGQRWEAGELTIGQERLLSSAIRNRLGAMIQMMGGAVTDPDVLCVTLEGERHELGLSMFALLAASSGLQVRYLGTDLPASELVVLAERLRPRAVAVSLVMNGESPTRIRELLERLPEGVALWVGGPSAAKLGGLSESGVCVARDPADMAVLIRSLR